VTFGHHRMCINTQVRHYRGVEEKEEEEPPERSLEAPQEEAAAEARPAKAGPTPAKLNTGYSRSARVSYVLAIKPPMLSFFLVTKLRLARGCLYIWVTLPLPRIEMN
jgi:hypothetical protein